MSSTPKCQRCERESRNGFLCPHCTNGLRETLRELPWWLDRLMESAVGQVRLGDGGKRAHDPGLVKYTGQHGDDRLADDLAKGDITAAKLAATGRANAASSTLYRQAQNTLTTWIRDICETRGATYVAPCEMAWNFIGPLLPNQYRQKRPKDATLMPTTGTHTPMALWLANHAPAIAQHEAAGELARDIDELRLAVERAVNRRESPRFCGPCPTELTDDHAKDCDREHPHACETRLMARKSAASVTCPTCKGTHDIGELTTSIFDANGHLGYTVNEIHLVMEQFGMSLPERTFRRWRADRTIVPMMWRSGEPLYRLDDVRELRKGKGDNGK